MEEYGTWNLVDILERLDWEVFSKEKWLDCKMDKVAEVTYSYSQPGEISVPEWVHYKEEAVLHWPVLNKTLFCDIGKMDIKAYQSADLTERSQLLDTSSESIKSTLSGKIALIDSYKTQIVDENEDGDEVLAAKKRIILWGLDEIKMQLEACVLWLPFEVEKALVGFHFSVEWDSPHVIPAEEREQKMLKIREINTGIYGEPLSNSDEYIKWCLDYFHTTYTKYEVESQNEDFPEARKLSKPEQDRYKKYLGILKHKAPDYDPQIKETPEKYISEEDSEKYGYVLMNKEDVLASFNHHNLGTWLDQRAVFNDDVGGITDRSHELQYPRDKPKFQALTSDRVDGLQTHEIWQHAFSIERHMKLIGNIRGASNLELSEGFAKLFEDLYEFGPNLLTEVEENGKKFQIIDVSKLSYVQNFPKTIMEELLTDEQFYDFLALNNKIEPDKMEVRDRYLRHKRTGMQRKDITYTTGKIKAAKYFNDIILWKNKTWKFSDSYAGKVWFHQIEDYRIIEQAANDNNPDQKLPENMLFHEAERFAVEQRWLRKKYRESEEFKANLDYYQEYQTFSKRKQRRHKYWERMNSYKRALKKHAVNEESFYSYLQKKYPFMDFWKEKIDSVRFWFKAQLLWAVKLKEDSINADEFITQEDIEDGYGYSKREEYMKHTSSRRFSQQVMKRWERELRKAA